MTDNCVKNDQIRAAGVLLRAIKNPSGVTGRVLYSDMFGEAKITILMKHLQTRDYKDENVPASCSCRASH
jgi:hypothetical protein